VANYNTVFQRLLVDNTVNGGTRVQWEMQRHFSDAGPYTFQLQVGHTGLNTSDDWIDVGAPVVDTYFTFDLNKRVWGKTPDPHYRVELTTGTGTYYSEPEKVEGRLQKRDWLTAREIIRKELLRHRVLTSPDGYLLKSRRYGPQCPSCLDQLTGEVSYTNCPDCYGTSFENGYFTPMPACFADVSLEQDRDHRQEDKGMDHQDVITARFIGDPSLYSYDVWVNRTSDERYYIHNVAVKGHVRGYPLIYDAELRLAPFSDIIYTFDI
jgi:hypothetical protein